PLPRPVRLEARHRLRGRRRARLQPGEGVPSGGTEGRGGQRPDAAGEAGRDSRRLRARRDRRPDQRDAARRGLELAASNCLHAPGADREQARLPTADRADHAYASAQGSRRRGRLRAQGGHAQRARRLAAQPARLRLLPRGRTRYAGAAAAPAAARPAEAPDRVSMVVERADFDDLVTLVTQAPTWEKDRVQGVRILLRAIGEGKADAPDQILARWIWRLARATRKVQDRRASAEFPEAKRLLGALANSRGHRHEENAAKLVNAAREQPLEVGAALLASAEGYTPRANQLIDAAREPLR